MPAVSIFVRPDEKSNRKQCGAGRDDHKNENQQTAEIFLLRSLAYFALRCRPNCQPIKREDHSSECIPTCNARTPELKTSVADQEHRHTGSQSGGEAMARVLTPGEIGNAHVNGLLS